MPTRTARTSTSTTARGRHERRLSAAGRYETREWQFGKACVRTFSTDGHNSATFFVHRHEKLEIVDVEGAGRLMLTATDTAGQRVVNVEKGRDGVLSAELKSAVKAEAGGVTYYDIDYVNESKRGNNHYATRVAIRDGKLYTLEVRTKIADYAELEAEVRAIVSSFRSESISRALCATDDHVEIIKSTRPTTVGRRNARRIRRSRDEYHGRGGARQVAPACG